MLVSAGGCPGPVTRLAQGSSGSTDHPVELKLIQPFEPADDASFFCLKLLAVAGIQNGSKCVQRAIAKTKHWLAELAEESPNV